MIKEKIGNTRFPKFLVKSLALLAFVMQNVAFAQPSWYNTSWSSRKAITIDHTKVSGSSNLTNFPVLISVASDSNLAGTAQSSGNDLVFTAGDGTTKLNHEIESYVSSTGQVIAWVQVPTVSPSADTVIYLYYGNPSASNQQNATAVWDSNYLLVEHMTDNAAAEIAADSTSNGNRGTTDNTTGSMHTTGQIGGAFDFNGSTDGITYLGISVGTTSTISVWVNETTVSGYENLLTQSNTLGLWLNGGKIDLYGSSDHLSNTAESAGTWYYVTVVQDGTNTNYYLNGASDGSYSNATASFTANGTGADNGHSERFHGVMDELRVSKIARSTSWIATEYNSQSSPTTFFSVGSQENSGITAIPTFSPAAGTYTTAQTVTISTTTAAASIRYTTDGSTPSETAGTLYSGPITVSATTTINAIAYASGFADSPAASAAYTINPVSWYNTSWSSRKAITIDHTKVSGSSNLTNFPVLISLASDSNLAGAAQSSGNDILFTAGDGATKLNHEIESYVSSTGQVIAWVQVPTVSPTADTVIYLYYGNPSASNQQNATGAWDSNYQAVYHLPNGTTLTATDSTSNGVNATSLNSTSAAAAEVGGGASFNGSTNFIDFGTPTGATNAAQGPATWSAWVKTSAGGGIVSRDDSNVNSGWSIGIASNLKVGVVLVNTDADSRFESVGTVGSNAWTFVTVVKDLANSYNLNVYLNGAFDSSGAFSGTQDSDAGDHLYLGNTTYNSWLSNAFLNGQLDEVRISNAARSAGWIGTEYNNESSPSTFFSVGSQQNSGVTATPTFSPGAGTYGAGQTVTISTTTSGASIRYTMDGSTPSETAGTLYSGAITLTATTTIKAIAYASGFVDSSVASGSYVIGATGPTISSLSPTSGPVGTAVTIAGSNFGASQGSNTVTFNGTSAGTASSWGASSITVAVPSGATTGNVVVTVSGLASSGTNFTVTTPPTISSLSPTSGSVSTSVTIAGSNFGASQGSSTVMFNGTNAGTASSWSVSSITVAVPSGATTGNVVVTVGGLASSGTTFTVTVPPTISSLSPTSGPVGTAVTIAGSNFGASQGSNTVTFNGTSAGTASSWGASSITVAVPSGATTGNVVVTVSGLASSGTNFTVTTPPTISSLSPTSGPVSTSVTIAGSNFGASQGSSTVTFNGTNAGTASSWSVSSITVAVPSGATTGNVVVTVGGLASSGSTFTVTVPPTISSLSPTSGPVGTAVTITGSNFGASQASSTVTFNGTSAGTASSWSASSITVAVPSGATTGNVVVTVTGLTSSGTTFTVTVLPSIISVSPTTAAAGAQITVSGSNFGSTQGTGAVWLGTTLGAVVTWSNTQIVATVSSSATSGTAQIQQNGGWSNSISFNVTTATISSVTPTSGLPGTQVTIAGSGFGATQDNGQVWLGTVSGVVQSWSDAQVVATVASGSVSGKAQVLQSGVWSNVVPFSVNALQITGLSPTTGVAGTSVTITGTGFGSSQGTGTAWLGSTGGQVSSWSDTEVVAAVASTAVTGVARVQQNGLWSNGIPFKVPGGSVTLVPNMLNLVVGDIHTIQALGSNGQPVTGLTWTSSDSTVVSLSTDDPPILTALAAGHVTITAGAASADVMVSAVSLPLGTVLWSNPGNGSGVAKIVPAVPSASGVADVFALQNDGTVQAITSDGTTAWSGTVFQAQQSGLPFFLPDFQGGLVVVDGTASSITKLDGITGQPYPAYTAPGDQYLYGFSTPNSPLPYNGVAVHTDGTIFTFQTTGNDTDGRGLTVVGIDPTTGTQKFSVPLTNFGFWGGVAGPIVGGDGNAYVAYSWTPNDLSVFHLMVLRISSAGTFDYIPVQDYSPTGQQNVLGIEPSMITSADTGVVLSWEVDEGPLPEYRQGHSAPRVLPPYYPLTYGMAITNGTSLSIISAPTAPGQIGAVIPVLQAEDGSFIGTVPVGDPNNPQINMIAFDATGNVRWSVPNEQPLIATDDGGVIGQSGIIYDQNGNATGQAMLPTYSWTGNAYQSQGSVVQISADLLFVLYDLASSFWPIAGGNYSGNETAYSLVRTFSDNETTSDIFLTSPSQTNPNQQTITNVLSDIGTALNSGSYAGCSAWLTGAAPFSVSAFINTLVTQQLYGHGTLNDDHTSAFVGIKNLDGTLIGVPSGWNITVNDQGAFFNAKTPDQKQSFNVGPRAYNGGSLKAQAAILIHELGHKMIESGGAAGFQHDADDKKAGRGNDKLVDQNCGKLIMSLK